MNDDMFASSEASRAVLIVGAGPSALALALSLVSNGINVRIVEKAAHPGTTSRATGVQARTLEMLEPYGVTQPLVECGRKVRVGNIYSQRRTLVRTDLWKLPSAHPYLLFVEQTHTERLMTEALAKLGITVEHGVELHSFEQTDTTVTATLRHSGGESEQAEFAYLAGCDGAHSRTRRQLGFEFSGKKLRDGFLLADLTIDSPLATDEFHVLTSPEGMIGVFPLANAHRLIMEMEVPPAGQTHNPTLEEMDAIIKRRIHIPLMLSNLTWSSYFQVNSRLTPSLQSGRVFLLGDAAHIHSPAGAQGMNTGIQDAFNLGWKLAFVMRGDASPALLRTYETERHPIESDVLKRTERLQRLVTMRSPVLRFLRDRIVPRLSSLPPAQHNGRMTGSQLAVSYRDYVSPKGGAAPNGVHAGDRVPDAWIAQDATVAPVRLHTIIAPDRFTLLIVRQPAAAAGASQFEALVAGRRMKIVTGQEVSGPGLASDSFAAGADHFYLVRPDGYLALHGPLAKLRDVRAYLEQLREPSASLLLAA